MHVCTAGLLSVSFDGTTKKNARQRTRGRRASAPVLPIPESKQAFSERCRSRRRRPVDDGGRVSPMTEHARRGAGAGHRRRSEDQAARHVRRGRDPSTTLVSLGRRRSSVSGLLLRLSTRRPTLVPEDRQEEPRGDHSPLRSPPRRRLRPVTLEAPPGEDRGDRRYLEDPFPIRTDLHIDPERTGVVRSQA